ncbi:hypothetical protein [Chamaesiphon polymorphus]|uniref:hypothetical protein n=1 Tax=Chamaesiphon polymorphus TaxID=2107691 RepID=UPI0015E739C9|nr:hypothetical protein [Chamaesiphon polymorphus]
MAIEYVSKSNCDDWGATDVTSLLGVSVPPFYVTVIAAGFMRLSGAVVCLN